MNLALTSTSAVALCLALFLTGGPAAAETPAAETPAQVEHADSAEPSLRLIFDYQTGPAAIVQNDGRYGAEGTSYGASDVGQTDNLARVERASLDLHLGRHTVVLLYAPFSVTTRFTVDEDFRFRDETFGSGEVVDHTYLFDGIRASWLYRLVGGAGGDWTFDLGASFQIRNADVAFSSAPGSPTARYASESDVGLVFAVKTRVGYRPATGPWALLDVDAFSTFGIFDRFSGGIYDLGLTLGVPVADAIDLTFTARLLGGGATVEERDFENWANFFSASVGARVDIGRLFGGR